MKNLVCPFCIIFLATLIYVSPLYSISSSNKTIVAIHGDNFYINNQITLKGVSYDGVSLEGLLPNSRMVQGIFDDLNPETQHLWKYPDTDVWNPDRNTNEFVDAMTDWRQYGLLSFTLNMQGGSPFGYSKSQPWDNSAFESDGTLRINYMKRLERILDKANELEMVVILGLFYFGQDERLSNESAVINAVNNTIDWLFQHNYRNVLIEINNECDNRYSHPILKAERVYELIDMVKSKEKNGYRYYVSTSFNGNTIPTEKVVKSSDYVLLHGNGVGQPDRITEMVELTRKLKAYRPMPIVFNEDDHYEFDKPANNMLNALKAHASWGYFDFRRVKGQRGSDVDEPFEDGFQSVPVDWKVSSERKKAFFELLSKITTAKQQ